VCNLSTEVQSVSRVKSVIRGLSVSRVQSVSKVLSDCRESPVSREESVGLCRVGHVVGWVYSPYLTRSFRKIYLFKFSPKT